MKKKAILLTISLLAIVVTAVSVYVFFNQTDTSDEARTQMLTKYELNDLSVKSMVNKLDRIIDEENGLNASINGTTLILYDNENKYDFELPSDEFYVSFAPYINEIHPCKTHNLVSCRGELFDKEFEVSVIKDDGTVIMDQKVRSMDSGFIGIWLPRNIEATLLIKYNDLSVSHTISTFDESDTCITTPLQLS